MNNIINVLIGLIVGVIFSIGLISVLTVFFVVMIPFIVYASIKTILKYLTTNN